MKFKVAKSALLDGMQVVQNIVGTRSTIPVLSNVFLSADKNSLTLSTTDLDLSVKCTIDADVSKNGTTTLPARRLFSIIRELSDESIEIEVDDKNVASVKCGTSFFKIIGIASEEFPVLESLDKKFGYTIDQGVLKEMLRKTSYSASTDETRYILNGVLLSFKGDKLTLVATDGRRLALVEHEVEFPKEEEIDMILPSKTVSELIHTLKDEGELKIYATDNQIVLEFERIVISSKLIDGTYPNYRQVIPAQCEERITIERESLLTALKRVSLLTTDKNNSVKMIFGNNNIIVSMNTPEVGEAKETIPVKYSGKEISVAFNPEFTIDPLKNLSSDEIYIELTDDLSPGVIKCDIPFLYVLMPMRA